MWYVRLIGSLHGSLVSSIGFVDSLPKAFIIIATFLCKSEMHYALLFVAISVKQVNDVMRFLNLEIFSVICHWNSPLTSRTNQFQYPLHANLFFLRRGLL